MVRDLCGRVYEIMEKSPKRFRYTLVNEIERLALDCMENLYRANRVKLDITRYSYVKIVKKQ